MGEPRQERTVSGLTAEAIGAMDEATLRRDVIIPLLKAMGFHDVREMHGQNELGKDIVCWQPDPLGDRTTYAVVAKAVALNGQARVGRGTAGGVTNQILQCFGAPPRDLTTGEERTVDQCLVISNQPIPAQAAEAIRAGLRGANRDRQVKFIPGDDLWDLAKKHLPQAFYGAITETHEMAERLDTHYRPDPTWDGDELTITYNEKFPGAAQERPITVLIPAGPAGEAIQVAIEQVTATGHPVTLTGKDAAAIQIGEEFRHLLGGVTTPEKVTIDLPAPVNTFLARVAIADGDQEALIFDIPLDVIPIRPGVVRLTNRRQPHPVVLRFDVQLDERASEIQFGWASASPNVADQYTLAQLLTRLSQPATIRVTDLGRHAPLFVCRGQRIAGNTPNPWWVARLADLTTVQERTGTAITLPERELTEEEIDTIAWLGTIVRTGQVRNTWEELETTLAPGFDQAGIDTLTREARSLATETSTSSIELFGVPIPLGRVRSYYGPARLDKPDAVRIQVARSNNEALKVRLVAEGNRTVEYHYLDWGRDRIEEPTQTEPPSGGNYIP